MALRQVAPSDVRFIQKHIDGRFKNGKNVNATIERIEDGLMDASDLPDIRVIKMDGKYYSFDNRRLYVFRVLEYRGLLDTIWVRVEDPSLLIPSRFDTENEGVSVINRGGTTHYHIPPKLQAQLDEEEESDVSSDYYYDDDDDYDLEAYFSNLVLY